MGAKGPWGGGLRCIKGSWGTAPGWTWGGHEGLRGGQGVLGLKKGLGAKSGTKGS